jgi:transposase, IS5 family
MLAMRPGKCRALDKDNEADALIDQAEKLKAGIRAQVEHRFGWIKRQFGFVKGLYCGLRKNTAQLFTLIALSNLWMVRDKLMGAQG